MYGSPARYALIIIILLQFSTAVWAGSLDDYYLQQFGEAKSAQLQKTILSVSADVQESARCGMPLKHALKRDWKLLEQSTQKVLAKQLASPALANEATYTSTAGHFKVHYSTSGVDAPDIAKINQYTGLALTSATDWAAVVAAAFENAYANYSSLGYQPAPTTAGAPYDVYLRNLVPQGFYGVTTGDQPAPSTGYPNAYTSWTELDNSFTDLSYEPAIYTPLQSLQITAAHEYHHAMQYGYNFYFDIWYAEATSTWFEDEIHDDVNQLYTYLYQPRPNNAVPAWFTYSNRQLDLDINRTSGGGYGRWIFNRYLAENHSPTVIRRFWEKLAVLNPATNPVTISGDIKMAPVLDSVLSASYNSSLGAEFFGFAKRVYTRGWSSHSGDINRIPAYSPVAGYASYPVNSSTAATPSVTLPHYSFAYYTFTPSTTTTSVTISLNKTSGIRATVFQKAGAGGAISEVPANSDGVSYSVSRFNTADEVALLIANTTDVDNHQANFSTDGSYLPVTEPTGGSVYQTPGSSDGSSKRSAGCFIATAAYGSYLHPQVQRLREFRDEQLLTNAPGRVFVALYYRYSPPLADFIARHPFLRGLTRLTLTPLVAAVVHPLMAALSLLLLIGAFLTSHRRRIKAAARSNTYPHTIRTT